MGRSAAPPWLCALAALLVAGTLQGALTVDQPSGVGGAGYALLFHDNVVLKKDFKNFPSTEFTFEAWLSTSDICHKGAIMSYAKNSESTDPDQRTLDANHFVIYDPSNVLACHDFETIDEIPDLSGTSCHSKYSEDGAGTDQSSPITTTFLSRTGDWHHLAVTWSTRDNGLTKIYQDGLLVAKATTGKTEPLVPNGSLMLGGEQDCYAGCTDPTQGYYGFMDEVRIWSTVRNQTQIINDMRKKYDDMTDRTGLVAYWHFDDLDTLDEGGITHDLSGNGNGLDLLTPPEQESVIISRTMDGDMGGELDTGALKFKNSYARAEVENMPTKSFTLEFWARTQLSNVGNPADTNTNERYAEFLTFATQSKGDGDVNNDEGLADTVFMDDAIRVERYLTEFNHSKYLKNTQISTLGAISVHINANRQGNGRHADNWIDFATEWTDDDWHHIAITWDYDTGETQLFFDGDKYIPFWRSDQGQVTDKDPIRGGVLPNIGKRIERQAKGSLVLGQNQECYGGCFSPGTAYDGYMANLRIWDEVLDPLKIQFNMFTNNPSNTGRLAMSYSFTSDKIKGGDDRDMEVIEGMGNAQNNLKLGSIGPTYEYSYAPLTNADFIPLEKPTPGYSGYAMKLHDEQVLMKQNFYDFPTDAITVEFWMWSIDGCWQGVPFSYAHGDYEKMDNAFLIFNYNNWGVSIMEEEGTVDDHNAGFGSTDGRWHHIAVTWESETGEVALYDNGRQAWKVKRSQGKKIPAGGTLVLGREQDCLGGCFDSRYGAAGDVQPWIELEYGAQDFFGVMDQIRIWNVARSTKQIYKGMVADMENGSGTANPYIDSSDPTLVAYWKFDEGKGYIVRDETPKGNDLHIMEEPDWLVMRWMERCGNGIKEGLEKCDDGNHDSGDGCSSMCLVEPGWECTPTSPSRCWKLDGSSPPPAPRPPPPSPTPLPPPYSPSTTPSDPSPAPPSQSPYYPPQAADASTQGADGGSNGPKSKKSDSGWTVLVVLCVAVGVVVLLAMVYRKREFFYDHFPQLEHMVNASQNKFGQMMGRQPGYDGVLSLDPEADMDHGFVDSQPPTAYQPPGRPIPYAPMPDAGGN